MLLHFKYEYLNLTGNKTMLSALLRHAYHSNIKCIEILCQEKRLFIKEKIDQVVMSKKVCFHSKFGKIHIVKP